MNLIDVFIIGAGPAGAIAGAKLVQAGVSVKIVEKLRFPRFVIGESLLPRCNELLENANMLSCVQSAGFELKGGAVFEGKEDEFTALNFSKNLGQKWGSSFQVKREEFDQLLINDAIDKGCDVAFETEVIAYDEKQNIITTKDINDHIQTYKAKKVLDASGYGKVLPRLLNLEVPSSLTTRRATFARVNNDIRATNETEGYIIISVVGENEAWIWNIPFSDGTTSVGIVCSEEYFDSLGMSDEEFWNHIIFTYGPTAKRYKNSEKITQVDSISAYSSSVSQFFGENYLLSGNASEFLDPVFSSGVTLALESGNKAAELFIRELQGEKIDYKVEYEDYMMLGINVFRDYVNSWYDGSLQTIIFSKKTNPKITQKIVSILSGYVWDTNNSFVTSSRLALKTTYEILK